MAVFLKFNNRYINVDNIAQVELDSTSDTCHDINIHPVQGEKVFVQLRVKNKEVADNIFEQLGIALNTDKPIDLDTIKENCISNK